MNEQVVKLLTYIAVALALIGIGALGAWQWQANSYGQQLAIQAVNHQADLNTIAITGAAQSRQALEKQQQAEQALANLDSKATQEKADDLAENELLRKLYSGVQADNDQLRADVTTGKQRLRIAGTCSGARDGSLPKTASTPSLGDAGTVELSAASGSTVFDIRAGIIADQAALKALQRYITQVCLSELSEAK
jgi:prophage endopeptidase